MAEGNEVSRSSGGPIGDFPLNPPWQEEEKMKPATETKPDMWKLADKYATLDKIKNNIPINAPLYQQRVYKEKVELDVKIEALHHYRESELFKKVEAAEQKRMIDQLQVMREYSHILAERILHFPQPNET